MRPLTASERGALDALLAVDFPGVAELRIQARTVRATEGCACGCPTVNLEVDSEAPRAAVTSGVPVEANVVDEGAGLILFVADGRLSLLEYWTTEDETPTEFPTSDRIRATAS
jgi:hypothetical protein